MRARSLGIAESRRANPRVNLDGVAGQGARAELRSLERQPRAKTPAVAVGRNVNHGRTHGDVEGEGALGRWARAAERAPENEDAALPWYAMRTRHSSGREPARLRRWPKPDGPSLGEKAVSHDDACYASARAPSSVWANSDGGSVVPGFVAIDFETANEDRSNACALGWAVVDNGAIANAGWTPLDPGIRDDEWSVFNSSINGFSARDVRGAPSFAAFWPTLRTLVEDRPVVAHYAVFDLSVLRAELRRYEVMPRPLRYGCSALLARAAWPDLLSVSLSIVERHLRLLARERDPGENARACATIVLRAIAALGQPDLDAALSAAGLVWGKVEPDLSWRACGLPHRHVRAADIVARRAEHDSDHPFFDRTVVFTGALASMTRREAFQRLVDVGGRPGDGVTKDTNVLVVGEQDIRRLAAGETLSAKQRKALALRTRGQDIQLIGEDDFVRSL